jgi:tetratricopeptide (TPR) repeat protein
VGPLRGEPAPRPPTGSGKDGRTAADRFQSKQAKRILFAMAGTVATSRFVGRVAELDRLEAAFAHASGGEPLTMCVGGEAGVGKTRLVTRFAGQVREGGGQVLLGGCVELGETALPFAPLAQALRGLVRGLEPAALEQLVGPGRPLLARLLPELGPDQEPTSAGSWGQARLFEAFLALLERLANRSPTVLVVEDLHWADRSTLDLLAFLHRNLQAGLLLVLTYRSDELHRRHPLRPFLAELDRSGRADRLEVGPFGRLEVTELLAGILGTRPDDQLTEQVYRRSEGNAFFAEELLAATHQSADNGRGLPPSLENVLLSRVQVLPEDAQATLRLVAAAGGPVEHELLAAVSELPEADLLAALRAAVAHQVLVPDPATETYAFRHALTQEALYAELLPGERARLHAAFARVLAERPDLARPDRAAAPARLAYHWVRAHEPARALPAAVEAGLQSEAAYGFADAQRHFETALELWDQVADAGAHLGLDRPAVLQHAAESAYLTGDPNRAITLTRAALADVDADADPVRAGLLHARLGAYLRATGGEGASAEYEAAVRLVPASPPLAERAQVLAAFGEALISQGRYRESRELCQEAIAIAGQVGALAEQVDARRALGVDLAFLGDLEAGEGQLAEARRIAEAVGKVDQVARAFATLSGLLETFGKLEAAAELALEGAELAAAQGLGRWHGPFLTATAARALFALGRWEDAEALLDRAADRVAPELATTGVYIHTARSQLDLARGRTDAAAEHLAVARQAYAQTVTQPWFAAPCSWPRPSWPSWRAAWPTPTPPWPRGYGSPAPTPARAPDCTPWGCGRPPTAPSWPAPAAPTTRSSRPAGSGTSFSASSAPACRPGRPTARRPRPAPRRRPCSARPSSPGSTGTPTPTCGRRPPRPGSGSASPTRPPTPAGGRPRRCCSAASAASRSSRRCAPPTRRRSSSARPRCGPRSRPWPAAAAWSWSPAPRPPRPRSRRRHSTPWGSPPASRRCWPWWRPGGPTPRSPRRCSSAPRRPPSTSATSSASWASATGSRRPPSPTGSGSSHRNPDRLRAGAGGSR